MFLKIGADADFVNETDAASCAVNTPQIFIKNMYNFVKSVVENRGTEVKLKRILKVLV